MYRLSCVAVGLVSAVCFGCGAPTEEDLAEAEALGEVSQPIWEATCNSVPVDETQASTFNGTEAAGYDHGSNCNKTFIKEVTNFSKPYLLAYVEVSDGAPATTQSACEASWGAAQLFKKNGSTWTPLTTESQYQGYGEWLTGGITMCDYPLLAFPASLFQSGETYRIHATMRTARQGSTKAIYFQHRNQIQ